MSERPWVTPQEVREYSEIASVQNRSDNRLAVDIQRAEQRIISYTNNDFSEYEVIPDNVKTAVILYAEAYAYNSVIIASNKKSETYDDYSYTNDISERNIDGIDIGSLLDPYVKTEPRNAVEMRLRKL